MVSMGERTQIIKQSIETVNGAFPIIVGAGAINTEDVIELCKHAQDCGADASLVITPYLCETTSESIDNTFQEDSRHSIITINIV